MGISSLKAMSPGSGANVIIVDQGFEDDYVRSLGGTLGRLDLPVAKVPGRRDRRHGSMLARNILKVAPDATLYDFPCIPSAVTDVQGFLNATYESLTGLLEDVRVRRDSGTAQERRPWVWANAWATFNRGIGGSHEEYTHNPAHPFNQLIGEIAGEFDVVFAAGNCGEYCPSDRCGPDDRGPGRSIIGANSHPKVLTVGAVRADGMWLGYSSQGPGTLAKRKPDLCAVSQFHEDDDAATVNTGTSAACALAAGVVAALRSRWGTSDLSVDALRNLLTDTATCKPPQGSCWDNQLGHGIINAAAAFEKMTTKLMAG